MCLMKLHFQKKKMCIILHKITYFYYNGFNIFNMFIIRYSIYEFECKFKIDYRKNEKLSWYYIIIANYIAFSIWTLLFYVLIFHKLSFESVNYKNYPIKYRLSLPYFDIVTLLCPTLVILVINSHGQIIFYLREEKDASTFPQFLKKQ